MIFFSFLHKIICCGYTLEAPHVFIEILDKIKYFSVERVP